MLNQREVYFLDIILIRHCLLRQKLPLGWLVLPINTAKILFKKQEICHFGRELLKLATVAEYNFLDYQEKRYAVNWTPYVFGGIGYSKFKPDVVTDNYKTNTFIIPYGVGIKYQIKRPWNIGLEYGSRKTFSDYIDNLGGDPKNNDKLQQGDPSRKDAYYYIRLSVSYTFYRIVCP